MPKKRTGIPPVHVVARRDMKHVAFTLILLAATLAPTCAKTASGDLLAAQMQAMTRQLRTLEPPQTTSQTPQPGSVAMLGVLAHLSDVRIVHLQRSGSFYLYQTQGPSGQAWGVLQQDTHLPTGWKLRCKIPGPQPPPSVAFGRCARAPAPVGLI
jgi:hypothetical protein